MTPNFKPKVLTQNEINESLIYQKTRTELCEENLKYFIIAYKKYVKELTIIEIKKLQQEINEDFETSCIISNYYNQDPFQNLYYRPTVIYIIPALILKKIKMYFEEDIEKKKEFIVNAKNFEIFLKKESDNIVKLEEIEKSEKRIQELKFKHIIRFVAIIYDDHIDWSGNCQDLAYCLSHSISGSAGEIINKIKGKIFYPFKETSLGKNLNECNNRKNSTIAEPSYYNEVKPFIKALI